MFLLDTNVISEIRKGRRSDSHVSNWYTGVDEPQLFISSLTIGEIRKGIELAGATSPRQTHWKPGCRLSCSGTRAVF